METDLEFRLEVNWNWTNSDSVCDVISRVLRSYLIIEPFNFSSFLSASEQKLCEPPVSNKAYV